MTDDRTRDDIRRLVAGIRVRLGDGIGPRWLESLAGHLSALSAYETPGQAIGRVT